MIVIHPAIAEMLVEKNRKELECLADRQWRVQAAENEKSRQLQRERGNIWSLALKRIRRTL
ncbi:hypothetical protein [Paenibacillus sophorae]|uniref:Uncharacterized protein n=1 Tax=Paenibacillus sophorae TaxID=1333845 RepID=A0ABX8HE74_9BACL|nr:hypothetical protein [Paenibacillus sophorae]QWU16429.1 hypothetical protein KP014_04075 [Paenibacillus sophorae]